MSHSDKVSKTVGTLSITSGTVKLGNTTSAIAEKIPAPSTLSATTATMTNAQVFGRIGTSNPSGGAITLTTPTAASMVAYQPGATVGDSYRFTIINTNSSNAITLDPGSGVTVVGSATIALSTSANFIIRFSNVTSSSEAAVIYRV